MYAKLFAEHQIIFPPTCPALVNRPRLVDRFQAGLSGTQTLISAPAGSGETTLLSEWRAEPWSKTPVAWISLDTGDNGPLRFFQYPLAAPDTLQPGIVQEIHPFLQTSEKLNYDAILYNL